MAKESKKAVRSAFRKSVFERANYRCECCKKHGYDRQEPVSENKRVPLDAHHITNRNKFKNGGYNKYNGISVCDECHLLAEIYHQTGVSHPGYSPEDLYAIVKSSFEKAKTFDM